MLPRQQAVAINQKRQNNKRPRIAGPFCFCRICFWRVKVEALWVIAPKAELSLGDFTGQCTEPF